MVNAKVISSRSRRETEDREKPAVPGTSESSGNSTPDWNRTDLETRRKEHYLQAMYID